MKTESQADTLIDQVVIKNGAVLFVTLKILSPVFRLVSHKNKKLLFGDNLRK